jgi:hypothetical protein
VTTNDWPEQNLDALWGAEAIGNFLNLNTRQVFHLLHTGKLPAIKVGDKWVSTKTQLRKLIEEGGKR